MKRTVDSKNNLVTKQASNYRPKKRVQFTLENIKSSMNSHIEAKDTPSKEPVQKTTIYIKNMKGHLCKIVVKGVLDKLGLSYDNLVLGEVEILGNLPDAKLEKLKSELLKFELEVMEDKKLALVKTIVRVIDEMIRYSEDLPSKKLSIYLSEKMQQRYSNLANLFLEMKGINIQQYIISRKIEWVKELLLNTDLSLSEISWKLHYSSVAHLSFQFKKLTGVSPSRYKQINNRNHGKS